MVCFLFLGRRSGSGSWISCWNCCPVCKGEFQDPKLCSFRKGLNLAGYYSTSSFTRLLAKSRSVLPHTERCILNHSVTLCCSALALFLSGIHLALACLARTINLLCKQVWFILSYLHNVWQRCRYHLVFLLQRWSQHSFKMISFTRINKPTL